MTATKDTSTPRPQPRESPVLSRDGQLKGRFTGGQRPCHEGCRGFKKAVRWEDGTLTYVCTQDLVSTRNGMLQLTPHASST